MVGGTLTVIGKAPLAAHRDTGQIKAPGGTGFDAERVHDPAPLNAMGPHLAETLQAVHQIVGHLVGHSHRHTVIKILGKNPRVVPNNPLGIPDPIHPRRTATQIENYRYLSKFPAKQFAAVLDETSRPRHNLKTLSLTDRDNIFHPHSIAANRLGL